MGRLRRQLITDSLRQRSHSLPEIDLRNQQLREIRQTPRVVLTRAASVFGSSNKKKGVVIVSACVNFTTYALLSVIPPFFPPKADEKDLSGALSGTIFSWYALVIVLSSPFMGKCVPALGAKFMFLSGLFVTGSCNILFGVVGLIEDQSLFAIFCLLVRTLEGLGYSAFTTVLLVYQASAFPYDTNQIVGLSEVFVGLGLALGPVIGGYLHSLGGYGLPFYVLGGLVLCCVPVCWKYVPTGRAAAVRVATVEEVWKLLKIPHMMVISSVICYMSMCWSFLDPTLEPHLRQFSLSSYQLGLVFLLMSSVYAVASPMFGCLADRLFHKAYYLMIASLLLTPFGLLILGGHSEILTFLPDVIWLNLAALTFLGITLAMGLIPTFNLYLQVAENAGFPSDLTTQSLVSGIWASVYFFGEVIGPALGGVMLDYLKFADIAAVIALTGVILAAISAVCFTVWPFTRSGDTDSEAEERKPLIDAPQRRASIASTSSAPS